MTEDEMIGWHHQLNGHEFQQILRDSEGQGNLAYCSSQGHKESDITERPSKNNMQNPNNTRKFVKYVYGHVIMF